LGEVLVISGALALGYPLPILPVQIIWLNFVTDGFLDIALAMEPKEDNLLKARFEKNKKYLIDKLMAKRMILMSATMAVGTLYLFSRYFASDPSKAWTISLTVMAVFQWYNAWNCRSEHKSVFQMNFFSNRFLIGATVIVIILQFLVIYVPFMQRFMHTAPLNIRDWLGIIVIASLIIAAEEIRKFIYRRSTRHIHN